MPLLKQVYRHYQPLQAQPPSPYIFCPHCAAKLEPRPVGLRQRQSCPSCGFVHFINPAPSVVMLITQGRQVLLGLRSGSPGRGKWALPSGYIEYDDDFLSAGRREALEETGLSVKITAVDNVISSFVASNYHFLSITLRAAPTGGVLAPGDDLLEAAWFSVDDSLPELAFAEDADAIQRFKEGRSFSLPVDDSHDPS